MLINDNKRKKVLDLERRLAHEDPKRQKLLEEDESDAQLSLAAAMRLRNGPLGQARQDRQMASATSHLLETIGHALADEASRIPRSVRRAALRLARASRHARPGPSGRDRRDHGPNPRGRRATARGRRSPVRSD